MHRGSSPLAIANLQPMFFESLSVDFSMKVELHASFLWYHTRLVFGLFSRKICLHEATRRGVEFSSL